MNSSTTQSTEPTTERIGGAANVASTTSKRALKPARAGIYIKSIIAQTIYVPIINVTAAIKQTLETTVAINIEGRCISHGYIKPGSCAVLSYSSGKVYGSDIRFDVVVECLVCNPVEGLNVDCIVKSVNKAGIRAEIDETPTPIVLFIARDHSFENAEFSKIAQNQNIRARVIGSRFELLDEYVSVIAELSEMR